MGGREKEEPTSSGEKNKCQGREKGITCLKLREELVCKLRGERAQSVCGAEGPVGLEPGTLPGLLGRHKGSGVEEGQSQM